MLEHQMNRPFPDLRGISLVRVHRLYPLKKQSLRETRGGSLFLVAAEPRIRLRREWEAHQNHRFHPTPPRGGRQVFRAGLDRR